MKVLNLQCAHQHEFEGWFGSEDDFTSQLGRGLVSCPLCGDTQIQKMLSAPRLNLRTGREDKAPAAPTEAGGGVELGLPASGSALHAQLLKAMRLLEYGLAQSQDQNSTTRAKAEPSPKPKKRQNGQTEMSADKHKKDAKTIT